MWQQVEEAVRSHVGPVAAGPLKSHACAARWNNHLRPLVFYSPNVVHRGRANASPRERLALTLNLVGANGLVPSAIPLAVDRRDAGRWWLVGGELVERGA